MVAKFKNASREERKAMIAGCDEARKSLRSAGWDEVCSIMADSHEGTQYGTLFIKRINDKVERVYVNVETYETIDLLLKLLAS